MKKPARKLRQGGSDYRCCIPALAGFARPQSTAPDGAETYRKASPEQQLALSEVERVESIDIVQSRSGFPIQWQFDTAKEFCLHAAMKWLALLLVALVQCSCTTEDHRALYRPDPLGGYGGSLVNQTTGTGFRSMPPPSAPVQHVEPAPAAKPEFRY